MTKSRPQTTTRILSSKWTELGDIPTEAALVELDTDTKPEEPGVVVDIAPLEGDDVLLEMGLLPLHEF